jgi:dihydrofolate reductase
MRKVILNVAVSLDGYIEGPGGEYDWCFTDQDYGMTAFMKRIDAIFLGRKSYELLDSVEPGAYPQKQKYVFSNTLPDNNKGYILINEDVASKVKLLKQQEGKDIWLFGGASLTTSFLNEGLIDELMLAVHPILLGEGKPLFSGIKERMKWSLADCKTFSSGLVQLFYQFNNK